MKRCVQGIGDLRSDESFVQLVLRHGVLLVLGCERESWNCGIYYWFDLYYCSHQCSAIELALAQVDIHIDDWASPTPGPASHKRPVRGHG